MPMIHAAMCDLNARFSRAQIDGAAALADDFTSGQPLHDTVAGIAAEPGTVKHRVLRTFLRNMPEGMRETLRGAVHFALSTSPPTPINFAWAPAYDYELQIWYPPCAISVLIKSRYPKDKRPSTGDGEA
jgi:hypothetical protein